MLAEGGLFSKNYQYLMSYRAIAFFYQVRDSVAVAELVTAGPDLGSRKSTRLTQEIS